MAIEEGTYCVVAGQLQQYKNGAWVDVSTVVQGPKGDKGDPGDASSYDDSAIKESIELVDVDQKNIVIEKTFDTASEIAVWVASNSSSLRKGTILRTLSDEPDFIVVKNATTGNWEAQPIPNIHATKVDYDDATTVKDKIDAVEVYITTEINDIDADITTRLAGKVDTVPGKGLSTNDYSDTEKAKLAGLDVYNDAPIIARVAALEVDPTTKTYVDAQDATTLAAAQAYADTLALGGGGEIDLTNYETKSGSDAKIATAKAEAISSADADTEKEISSLKPKEYFITSATELSDVKPIGLGEDIAPLVTLTTTEQLLFEFSASQHPYLKLLGTNSYTGKLSFRNINPAYTYQLRFEHVVGGQTIFSKQMPAFQTVDTVRNEGFNVINSLTVDSEFTDATPVFRVYGKVLANIAG